MNRPTEGMWIVAEGLLGENEEFLVYRWSLPTEASKAPAATTQPLPSFYRPVAAATVPNAPLPPAVPPAVSSASAAPTVPASTVPEATSTAVPTVPAAAPTVPVVTSTATSTVPVATPTAAPTVPAATPAAASSTQIHCDLCGTGPFLSQLELQGHMSTAHPVRRTRKVGSKSSSITGSKKPEEPVNVSTAPANVLTVPADIPIPAVSTPVSFAASPEQATLPAVPAAPSTPTAGVQAPAAVPVAPTASATTLPTASATTLPTASAVTPPAASAVTPPTPATPASTTPEIVGGTSTGAEKYAKLCGLVRKPLADFKNQFEASFPGHEIAKVLEAAHCTILDEKVVFVGGGEPKQ